MKSTYTCETKEGGCEVTLGDPIPVRVVYEEMNSQPIVETTTEPVAPVVPEEPLVTDLTITDVPSITDVHADPVPTVIEPKVEQHETTTINTAPLADSEKEELAAYRRQAKLSLIDSFVEAIPAKELEIYTQKVDEYSKEDLQHALNDAFVRNFKNNPQTTIGFSWAPEQKPNSAISDDERIAQEIREKKHRGNK